MKTTLRLVVTCVAALGIATATATGAMAAPPDPSGTTSANALLGNGQSVNSTDAARVGAGYWTPERMRRAVPMPDPVPGAATSLPGSATKGSAGSTPPAAAIASAAATMADGNKELARAINESAVAGRIFFHKPSGGDFACSGSALNSPSKQLVVTAGHCVHEGKGGGYMQNWVFVPRYRNGSAPFGTFAAKQFRTFNAWINNSDLNRDVAMVTTFPLSGKKLVNVVGGHGLTWNASRAVAVTILAYPGNFSGGESQTVCQGTTRNGGGNTIAINCNFGGGSSGGGWLVNFNNSTGRGNVNATMSTLDTAGVNRASYFDDAVKTMFDAQGSVT